MAIEGKQIYLRAMEPEDMEMCREMINDEDVSQMVVGWSFPVCKKEQMEWYDRVALSKTDKRFTVCLKENDSAVGVVTLTDIDLVNRSAFHGIKLHPSCPKGKGIGTDAVITLMKYAFEEINLNRLDGSWIEYNIPSKKLYEKCGWYEEGTKKEAIYRNGQYHDLKIAGITRREYLQLKEKNNW